MPPTDKTTVLLVSTSDLWTMSARSVLAALPGFELLDTAHGGLTAYQTVLDKQPDLLIVDDSLPTEEAQMLVNNVRAATRTTFCIWVVSTARQKKVAQANVADTVITNSGSTQQLITAVLSARDQHSHS